MSSFQAKTALETGDGCSVDAPELTFSLLIAVFWGSETKLEFSIEHNIDFISRLVLFS